MRASNVSPAISGTGIGLASVRQVIEQHGGVVEAHSREGYGSTFIVRLPM
jgi:signal transduction histidine kinase